ncbi:MAG TPA: ABC transporter permease [Candidatus Methylomirabilis sp.]|nr:ABC transporter permease [Candidatus Methylomirabilis sp.]
MRVYILRRLALTVPTILGASVLVFLILHLVPGDPAMVIAGPTAPADVVANIRAQLGLDQPVLVQYGRYLASALRGDLGRSILTRREVTSEIGGAFLNTVELVIAARIWSLLVAIPIGVVAAVMRRSAFDRLSMVTALLGLSLPIFWIGLMAIWLFAFKLGWFPISGRGGPLWTIAGLHHLVLPALTLGVIQVPALARLTRSSLLEALAQDYVRTARAKGLAEPFVVAKHALRNALLPVVTVVGLQFAGLLGGAVVTETIFSWPGLGRLAVTAILTRDFPVVQGTILISAVTFVTINLLVDLLYVVLDPRIKYS